MRTEHSDQLLEQLQSIDLALRYDAAVKLAKLGSTESIETLVEFVEKRHFQYHNCYEVVELLGDLKDERAVDPLIGLLELPSHVVGTAMLALLNIDIARGNRAVFEIMRHLSPALGWSAASMIADREGRFIKDLLVLIRDDDALMRARVAYALGIIASSHSDSDIEAALTVTLKDTDAKVRHQAASAIAKARIQSAFDALMIARHDSDIFVRQSAAEGLYNLGIRPEESLLFLIDSLTHEHWLVCRGAIWALQRIAHPDAVEPLIQLLQHHDETIIRSYAANALAVIQDQRALQPLLESLSDTNEYVRTAAVKAVVELGGPAMLPKLTDALFDTELVVQQAVIETWERFEYHPI
ncbi:MAG: HEAT repeat domain-containing protein [Chloroflexi bacterium]|nr:HEAT repeat domain-containing protein [Chloroflexota bacterium]